MQNVANVVMARFRLRGVTVKSWAERHRFKPDTVYKTIYGIRGKLSTGESARIRESLRQEGYWPDTPLPEEKILEEALPYLQPEEKQ